MSDSPFGRRHKHGDCYATWYIRRKAQALAGKYGLSRDDVDDIAQDLCLLLIKQWPQFDPTVGKATTFIQNVVDTRVDESPRFPLAESFEDVMEAIMALYSDTHDYQTVVVDSADWLEQLIWKEVVAPASDDGARPGRDVDRGLRVREGLHVCPRTVAGSPRWPQRPPQ